MPLDEEALDTWLKVSALSASLVLRQAPMDTNRRHGWLVLALFFCSGATALIYEVVWSKYLSQMFGSTIYAQTVVLAVFMGGLALGNKLFGGKADRLRRPLRAYGIVEMAIGLYAFFFSYLYTAADQVFVSIGSNIFEQRWLLLALKGVLSVGLLIIPTLLMGGTLPLIAAWLQKSSIEAGRRSARFYSVNSLGAVCGSALAGFYLVQKFGIVASLQAAAMFNVLVGSLAMVMGRVEPEAVAGSPDPSEKRDATPEISPGTLRWAGVLVAITGGVSMGLEVLASRSLALLFGSSLQAFAIVLISFILGIGIGAAIIASPRWRAWRSEPLVVFLLLGAATWLGLLVFKIEWWMEFYRLTKSGLAQSTMGYVYNQLLATLLSLIVLGVPAAMLGSVLPLLIRALSGQAAALGAKVGQLLTWNTLGAVGGVLLTGFLLMPHIGLRNAYGALASVLCVVAAVTAWRERVPKGVGVSAGVGVLLILLFALEGDSWRHVMNAGAFRNHEREPDFTIMQQRKKHITILFYEDAADATVSVEKGRSLSGDFVEYGLRVNGKPDASTYGDLSTQLLVGHLPILARPDAKDVFILGLGSGITGGAILGHPVERLVIAENCEPVVRAAKFFEPWNGGVLTDKRATIEIEDARTVLKLNPQKYDVIITQPSNPWMAGVGSVFSREYYELAASRLKEDGVVAQWFHLYDMHDGIVFMVLRTFGTVFPHLEIWDTGTGDIVMLGSKTPWSSTPAVWKKGFERDRPRQNFTAIGIHSLQQLAARQFASQRTAFAIAGEGPIQTDLFPVLEYEAPRAFYLGITSRALARYDERTHQRDMAPPERMAALRSLNTEQIRQTFSAYWTINHELQNYLLWRLRHEKIPDATEPLELRVIPCAFRPSDPAAYPPASASKSPETAAKLSSVMNLLEGPSARRIEGVNLIESMLRDRKPTDDWSAGRYAVLAARTSLGTGDITRTRSLLKLGLQWDPANGELQYFARILEREQPRAPKLSATD